MSDIYDNDYIMQNIMDNFDAMQSAMEEDSILFFPDGFDLVDNLFDSNQTPSEFDDTLRSFESSSAEGGKSLVEKNQFEDSYNVQANLNDFVFSTFMKTYSGEIESKQSPPEMAPVEGSNLLQNIDLQVKNVDASLEQELKPHLQNVQANFDCFPFSPGWFYPTCASTEVDNQTPEMALESSQITTCLQDIDLARSLSDPTETLSQLSDKLRGSNKETKNGEPLDEPKDIRVYYKTFQSSFESSDNDSMCTSPEISPKPVDVLENVSPGTTTPFQELKTSCKLGRPRKEFATDQTLLNRASTPEEFRRLKNNEACRKSRMKKSISNQNSAKMVEQLEVRNKKLTMRLSKLEEFNSAFNRLLPKPSKA